MGRRSRSPRDLLTPAALHILMVLAGKDLHGYGIKQEIEERTGGRLRLGPGTLYEAVHRMEADGWIEETPGPDDADPKRKYYRLAHDG
ncbi:MAG TPA: PadR family transcriptional regulator, partial [Longimicrobiales bacterium]|nr:PadR family transcriptional regulator [Longimicrobiales bacterium]